MSDSPEKLFGPEATGFYRLFLEPDFDHPHTFTLRLAPSRSQHNAGSVLVTVTDMSGLERVLALLRVDGYSRWIGQDSAGFGLFEFVPSTVSELISRLQRADTIHDQRLTLLALSTTPAEMSPRIEAVRALPGVTIRHAAGSAA